MQTALQHDTLHPTLTIALPSMSQHALDPRCVPSLLVHLPPALFFDPFTSSSLKRHPLLLSSRLIGPLELEKPVGWSRSSSSGTDGSPAPSSRSWWKVGDNHSSVPIPIRQNPQHATVEARLRAATQSHVLHSHADHLALEHTALLLRLDSRELQKKRSKPPILQVPLHVRYMPPRAASLPAHSSFSTSLVEGAKRWWKQTKPYPHRHPSSLSSSSSGQPTTTPSHPPSSSEDAGNYYVQPLASPTFFVECPDSIQPSSYGWQAISTYSTRFALSSCTRPWTLVLTSTLHPPHPTAISHKRRAPLSTDALPPRHPPSGRNIAQLHATLDHVQPSPAPLPPPSPRRYARGNIRTNLHHSRCLWPRVLHSVRNRQLH
ncbi:hypothetical protein ACQY0O_005286 [Thecaphora frezii]